MAKPRIMRKETIKYLKKQAEKLWGEIVLKNFRRECFVCGNKLGVLPHHFVPERISLDLRYDPKNGICLCQKCHIALHQKSDPMIILIIAFKKGKDWIRYLEQKRKQEVHPNKKWYREKIKNLYLYNNE